MNQVSNGRCKLIDHIPKEVVVQTYPPLIGRLTMKEVLVKWVDSLQEFSNLIY